MAFQVSPGINTSEIDLTTIVPAVSTTAGALAGLFRWGPIGQAILVGDEATLASRFGEPTNFNAETFFTGAAFLAYGNQLYISRAANTSDSSANGTWSAIADNSGALANAVANGTYAGANAALVFNIKNSDAYTHALANGDFATNSTFTYVAKYPGALGDSLTISQVDTAAGYSSNLVGIANATFAVNSNTANLNFNDSNVIIAAATSASNLASYTAWAALTVGDYITVGNSTIGTQDLQVASKGTAPAFYTSTAQLNSNTIVSGLGSTANLSVGMVMTANATGLANNLVQITAIVNSTAVTINSAATATASVTINAAQEFLNLSFTQPYKLATVWTPPSTVIGRKWQYWNSVGSAPGTSHYMAQFGNTAAVDQVHVVVVDALGLFTGVPGQVLEVFQGLSRASDAMTQDGSTNYYVNVLNQNSQYVWWTNHRQAGYSNTAVHTASLTDVTPQTVAFTGGQDGFTEANVGTNIGTITAAYDLFKSTENLSISLLMTGKSDDVNTSLLGNYLMQNIAELRKDCVVFISPNKASVVNNVGNELSSILTFRNGVSGTSYGVMDTGYKYTYDKYNDIYRYVPLNGDIAGLCVYTDNTKDPWWSPAGFQRGQIKNVIKLSYNPSKTDRDVLYPAGVNPVVTFPGQGTVLYGDKTLQPYASAFDRINVRRLFIVLEKAISAASQFALFEFNDAFTQAQFVSLVTPFLRDVQGRRGIYDFKVVCDSTNNTAQVVDSNRFVGDIYIKPARSINFIQLNFVAVRTGVDFTEIVGKF